MARAASGDNCRGPAPGLPQATACVTPGHPRVQMGHQEGVWERRGPTVPGAPEELGGGMSRKGQSLDSEMTGTSAVSHD